MAPRASSAGTTLANRGWPPTLAPPRGCAGLFTRNHAGNINESNHCCQNAEDSKAARNGRGTCANQH
eukprot:4278026-Lingulodinium_polyedra.AAC.1